MFSIPITGLKDGQHQVSYVIKAGDLQTGFQELSRDVAVEGILKKNENKFTFTGTAITEGDFVCDLSLEPYSERVSASINFSAIQNSAKMKEEAGLEKADGLMYISDDAREIEIGELVSQELILALPMKRVAPHHRNKDLEDIYPQFSENKGAKDNDTWNALKNIQIN